LVEVDGTPEDFFPNGNGVLFNDYRKRSQVSRQIEAPTPAQIREDISRSLHRIAVLGAVLGPGPVSSFGPCPFAQPSGIATHPGHERFQMSLNAIYSLSHLR